MADEHKFWEPSDPPNHHLKEWCEAEVHAACEDMIEVCEIFCVVSAPALTVIPVFLGDWSLEGKPQTLREILIDQAKCFQERDGKIRCEDGGRFVRQLDDLEAVIREVRAMLDPTPTNGGRCG